METRTLQVNPEDTGTRLDAWLAGQLPDVTRSAAARLCEEGRVRLGESCLFFPKFSGTTYLPYSQIVNAYLRQEEVNANLCCGRANFDQWRPRTSPWMWCTRTAT